MWLPILAIVQERQLATRPGSGMPDMPELRILARGGAAADSGPESGYICGAG